MSRGDQLLGHTSVHTAALVTANCSQQPKPAALAQRTQRSWSAAVKHAFQRGKRTRRSAHSTARTAHLVSGRKADARQLHECEVGVALQLPPHAAAKDANRVVDLEAVEAQLVQADHVIGAVARL